MAIITSAVLGTLVGGLTSILPGVLDLLNNKEKFKYEKDLLALKLEASKQSAKNELDFLEAKADIDEGESLRRHDSSLSGEGFIGALRASIRPVITYVFFMLFVAVKMMTIYVMWRSGLVGDISTSTIAWNEFVPIIWDADTSGLFGAVMGFWFGSRQIEKLRN